MIGEIVRTLGVSGSIATAIPVAATAWYLWRAGALVGIVLSIFSSLTRIAIALLIFVALGIALGWIDLGGLISDLVAGIDWIGRSGIKSILELIERLIELVGK